MVTAYAWRQEEERINIMVKSFHDAEAAKQWLRKVKMPCKDIAYDDEDEKYIRYRLWNHELKGDSHDTL